MKLDVTITSDVAREHTALKGRLARFPKLAERILRRAVEIERSTHNYVNRTYTAEMGTRFQVVSDDGQGNVTLETAMDADYSSYLQKNDWSRFELLVRKALDKVHSEFQKLA